MAKTQKSDAKRKTRVGDAAFLPRCHLPAAPAGRQTAGIWFGRFSKLPAKLRQIFLPLAEPNLPRLENREIVKSFLFYPQVGTLVLELRDDEIWATFFDTLHWACLLLQLRRRFALALRYRTFVRSPEGRIWIWLPHQIVFPPDFRPTLFCVVCQISLLERSPPFWKQNDNLYRETDEAPCPQIGNRWLDAAKPRALRAPNDCLRVAG